MDPIEGRDVTLYFMKGIDLVPYVCVESFSMDFNKTTKETKTIGTGNWSRPRSQRNAYSINCSGLIPLGDDPTDVKPFELLDYFAADSEIEFRAVWKVNDLQLKVIDGIVLVTQGTFVGNSTDFADASFTLQGVGAPSIRDTLEICDAEINESNPLAVVFSYEGSSGGNDTFQIQVNDVSGSPASFRYSIDGGGELTSYSSSWYVSVPSGSTHSIAITPVCDNGEEGEPFTTEFGLG